MRMSIILRAKGGKVDFPKRQSSQMGFTNFERPGAAINAIRAAIRHVRRSVLSAGPRLLRHCCRWPPPIMSEMFVRRALHRAALLRSAGSAVSAEAIANPPPLDHAIGDLAPGLKYRDRTDLAPMMAGWMLRSSDGIIGARDVIGSGSAPSLPYDVPQVQKLPARRVLRRAGAVDITVLAFARAFSEPI
jgi:hypothetical protein